MPVLCSKRRAQTLGYSIICISRGGDVVLANPTPNGDTKQAQGNGFLQVRKAGGQPALTDWDSKVVVLEKVTQNGLDLQHASGKLKADKDVVMAAVKKDVLALQYASEDLRADKDVVMAAVNQKSHALQFASSEVKECKIICALNQAGFNTKFPQEVASKISEYADCSNKEVAMAAVRQNGYNLKYASEKLQGDKDLVLLAVKQTSDVLQYVAEHLKNDPEVLKAAERGADAKSNLKALPVVIADKLRDFVTVCRPKND